MLPTVGGEKLQASHFGSIRLFAIAKSEAAGAAELSPYFEESFEVLLRSMSKRGTRAGERKNFEENSKLLRRKNPEPRALVSYLASLIFGAKRLIK